MKTTPATSAKFIKNYQKEESRVRLVSLLTLPAISGSGVILIIKASERGLCAHFRVVFVDGTTVHDITPHVGRAAEIRFFWRGGHSALLSLGGGGYSKPLEIHQRLEALVGRKIRAEYL